MFSVLSITWSDFKLGLRKSLPSIFKKSLVPFNSSDTFLKRDLVSLQNTKIKSALSHIFNDSNLLDLLYQFYIDEDNALLDMLQESIINNNTLGIKNALRLGANLSQHYEEIIPLAAENSNIRRLLQKQVRANEVLKEAMYFRPANIIDAIENLGAQVSVKISKNTENGGYYHLINWCLMHRYWNDIVESCLKAGADVRSKDSEGLEPLHYAARVGDVGKVQFLIAHQADINAKNFKGIEPIHCASMVKNPHTIRFLIGINADPQAKASGESDMQPVHIATLYGNLEVVEYLISIGVTESVQTSLGNQVVHLAARMDHIKILQLCFEKNLDLILAKNNQGMQPLHYAAKYNQISATEYLLHSKADACVRENDGRTPLDLAEIQGNVDNDLLEMLRKATANAYFPLENQSHNQNLDIQVLSGVDGLE